MLAVRAWKKWIFFSSVSLFFLRLRRKKKKNAVSANEVQLNKRGQLRLLLAVQSRHLSDFRHTGQRS
jgi:hypothetical protein